MSTASISNTPADSEVFGAKRLHQMFLPVETMLDQPIVAFMRLRLMARSAHELQSSYRWLCRLAERARSRLEGGPFNAHRITQLDEQIAAINAELKVIRDHVQHVGAVLIEIGHEIDKVTTLEQRLELLNCNHADRGDIEESDCGMVLLMAAYCVEDSAFHRNDQWNDRPLHAAVNAEIHRVMFKTPEGRVASDKMFGELFAPGGLFEGVPTYYRQPDGTMLRKAPSLTVHDADGSRVIERKPS